MSPAIVTIAIVLYIALLFWLAQKGDRAKLDVNSWVRHPMVYALALGVYCTSWTFYGLVGSASISSTKFIPILLGPILLFTVGRGLLHRIYEICRAEHVHNIADFLSSRYGKRQGIAATVTLVVLLATVPYISLQLKAVSDTLVLVIGSNTIGNIDLTFYIAAAMVLFALLFGAKQLDVSSYHGGLVAAIAFESVVKLISLMSIAGLALYLLNVNGIETAFRQGLDKPGAPMVLDLRFFVETGLAACAILCLPRMFQITFVECLSKRHLKTAQIVFPVYLIAIGICIYIIAQTGNSLLSGKQISADSYVIALPLTQGFSALTLVAFIGGFSAATAMIIIATVTLSQMLSNDVILPLIMKRESGKPRYADYSRLLMLTRRVTVALVVFCAYLYHMVLSRESALTSIGLIAFALSVHLAPAILLGLYWKNCNAKGVYAGLFAGLTIWAYMLLTPLLSKLGYVPQSFVSQGLFNQPWLSAESFLGFTFSDQFVRSVLISLSFNVFVTIWVSRRSSTTLSDRIQANTFTQNELIKPNKSTFDGISISDLKELIIQFAGKSIAQRIFDTHQQPEQAPSKEELITNAQRALSGLVGVASSQAMIENLRSGQNMALEDVVTMFGETTKALRFNQDILFSSFENISSGISVVNAELDMVAWNQRYEEMFNYPKGMLQIGTPVKDLVHFNASRGLLGEGETSALIDKRMNHLLNSKPYRVVRNHSNGQVIEIKGMPLPDGGYVTTYDDISDFIHVQKELEATNQNLESRVASRTKEVRRINEDLKREIELRKEMELALLEAKAQAEKANNTKSQFLALASHDILQPLNAAQLYANSLLDSNRERRDVSVLGKISQSISSAESIISSLLEISRIDMGSITPTITHFKIDDIMRPLVDSAKLSKSEKVSIHYVPSSALVQSDQGFLSRVLQNFISNAVKYTQEGKVLIGCRRMHQHLRVCVYDTGHGIADTELDNIFNDFYRSPGQTKITGLGLGLSVAKRLAELLEHKVEVHSKINQGSCFCIDIPISHQAATKTELTNFAAKSDLENLSVVYVDDGIDNLNATEALLNRWKCKMVGFSQPEDALEYCKTHEAPDILLMDFQLNHDTYNGIQLAKALRLGWGNSLPVCIISAAAEPDLQDNVRGQGFDFLKKPVKPAKLRALLTHLTVVNHRKHTGKPE
jgi:Na+/proline symporter/signal transduction histidine kinase/CheY-like chemotaxis protein